MNSINVGSTKALAEYLAKLSFAELPDDVVVNAKMALIDSVGNIIGGASLDAAEQHVRLAQLVGEQADGVTVFGHGIRASLPLAVYANTSLGTLLDYSDTIQSDSGRMPVWAGALSVPAALSATQMTNASGQTLLTSIVAGYECASRVIKSMDISAEGARKIAGATTSTLAAAGAAGKAIGLSADGMTSAIGMAGTYTPVSAGYKWWGDEGLRPRKDIKQGWGWMALAGSFSAVSADSGLQMLQKNNILDGDLGYWRMLGMDTVEHERITEGLGERYYILDFLTKKYPGCVYTHSSISGALKIVQENNIPIGNIRAIKIATNSTETVGFDDKNPISECDKQFSMPYQVSAALSFGRPGPSWYKRDIQNQKVQEYLMGCVEMSFDEECQKALDERRMRMAKLQVVTADGATCETIVYNAPRLSSYSEITSKFMETVSQSAGKERAEELLSMLENCESVDSVAELAKSIDDVAQEAAQYAN